MSSVDTMKTWAIVINSYDKIPEEYKECFKAIVDLSEPFPYTVFAPPIGTLQNKTNSQIICVLDDRICFFEKTKKEIILNCFYFKNINYIENCSVLLSSWIKISGISNNRLTSITVSYNTVIDYIFTQIIKRIRESHSKTDYTDHNAEMDKFNYLDTINFKLMNYAKQSIQPGDKVEKIILQPEIRIKILKVFGRTFFKTISEAYMNILTDKELIIIKNNESNRGNYGGSWIYIPLTKILNSTVESDNNKAKICFSLKLPEGDNVTLLVEDSNRIEAEAFAKDIDRVKTGKGVKF